jgi:hypothetical protein
MATERNCFVMCDVYVTLEDSVRSQEKVTKLQSVIIKWQNVSYVSVHYV